MRLRIRPRATLVLVIGLWTCAGLAQAPDRGISRTHHPWGRFQPGAWKLVRVVTETFDDKGQLSATSTTDTRTTLLKVDADGVTLEVAVSLEVAGKRFDAEPQVVRQGFHGELITPGLKLKPPAGAQLTLEGRKIACQSQQLEASGSGGKTVAVVYYCDTAPFILKRESTTTGTEDKTVLSETSMDVMATDMPLKVLAETKNTALLRTIHKHPKGTITTWAFTSPEIPGGVISHSSKELDKNGRLVRRSTLELLDYGSQPEPWPIVPGRKRPLRLKPPRYPVP